MGELEKKCRDLEARLRWADEKLKERSGRMYEIEKHYASEHFELQESMRELRNERMRLAGVLADRKLLAERAKQLQARIGDLKERLRKYEPVEDSFFDSVAIR